MSSSLNPNRCGPPHPIEEQTWFRLVECHGYERAKSIVEGTDPEANADIKAWRELGRIGARLAGRPL
jgi:hypothetical protein